MPHNFLCRIVKIKIYKFVMFSVFLCGVCTCSCLSRRVFENGLNVIFWSLERVTEWGTEEIA